MFMTRKNLVRALIASGAIVATGANAVALDVSAATGSMADVGLTVPVVGAAILAVLGLMAAWKLARGLFA